MKRPLNKKRFMTTIAACGMAGALMLTGTAAYLTDQEAVDNHFTVGSVKVELTEPDYPGNDDPSVQNETPGQETLKNPQIKNVGKNDAVVFMKVTVPLKDITPVSDDGTKGQPLEDAEVYFFKQASDAASVHANNFRTTWTELTSKESSDGTTKTYVFGYSTAIEPGTSTDALFDKVQLRNILEMDEGELANIVVDAYAIQADNILSGDTSINTSGTITSADLNKIYDTYVKQSA